MASSTTAMATEPLWGSTPIKTFMSAGTSVSVGSLPLLLGCAKDILSSGGAPIPPLSHSARRVLYGGTQAENKPTDLTGDRKLPSDPCVTGVLEA
jgi:hypothetical protein